MHIWSKFNYDVFLTQTPDVKFEMDANAQYIKSGWEIFAETLVDLTSATAWPIFALTAMLFFGNSMKGLISRTKTASIAGNTFDFHDGIQKVKEDIADAEAKTLKEKIGSADGREKSADTGDGDDNRKSEHEDKDASQGDVLEKYEKNFINAEHYNKLFNLAEISPKAAILEAYAYVDYEWAALVEQAGWGAVTNNQGWMRLDSFGNNESLTAEHKAALERLRNLRNTIVHSGDNYSITTLDAQNYIVLAFRLAALFREMRAK